MFAIILMITGSVILLITCIALNLVNLHDNFDHCDDDRHGDSVDNMQCIKPGSDLSRPLSHA